METSMAASVSFAAIAWGLASNNSRRLELAIPTREIGSLMHLP
jgi:hypothetical protein